MIAEAAHALWKRSGEANPPQAPNVDLPGWAYAVLFIEFIAFIPLFVMVNYTFQKVFPILAIVEDEKPPVYDPVSTDPNSDADANNTSGGSFANGPVTSSFLDTFRLLRSTGGFSALFRGLSCYAVQSILRSFIVGFFLALPFGTFFSVIGDLVASLALVQLSTAWVHIIMTPRSDLHFWRRMLPFKYIFTATWKPTVVFWASTQLIRVLYIPIRLAFDVNNNYKQVPEQPEAWRALGAIVLLVLLQLVLILPAYVILVRVQASLLPEDTETIVPFDRSFDGQVEPAVVGGRGYATIEDAWKTLTKPAWCRVVKLYAKLTAIIVVFMIFLGAILIPQIYFMALNDKKGGA